MRASLLARFFRDREIRRADPRAARLRNFAFDEYDQGRPHEEGTPTDPQWCVFERRAASEIGQHSRRDAEMASKKQNPKRYREHLLFHKIRNYAATTCFSIIA